MKIWKGDIVSEEGPVLRSHPVKLGHARIFLFKAIPLVADPAEGVFGSRAPKSVLGHREQFDSPAWPSLATGSCSDMQSTENDTPLFLWNAFEWNVGRSLADEC